MAKERKSPLDIGSNGGFLWNCVDMKLLLSAFFFLCSIAIFIQTSPSISDLFAATFSSDFTKLTSLNRSSPSHSPPPPSPSPPLPPSPSPPPPPFPSPPPYIAFKKEERLSDNVVKRVFNPVGSAAYLFVQMGAYRGGRNNFVLTGLASKPLHVFGKPKFQCEWQPHDGSEKASIHTTAYTILPDWGYGRVYTVVVVNCTFAADVGADASGGRLVIHASTGGGGDRAADLVEKFVALEEAPGSLNATVFTAPPEYDYLYCGSSLYGDLNPHRVREWIAYHARLFGARGHFVFHDAGGIQREVRRVLQPWMEKGMVTLQDIREQERFDGYYYNQFLVVNDCLHRYKFKAKWIFFFDVDEFIYVPPPGSLKSVMRSLARYSQFTIEQMPMSSKLCKAEDRGKTPRMWGIEKLVYRDVKRGIKRDRKYAIQPRYAYAAGVHMSQNMAGKTLHRTEGKMKYFHYHGTISDRSDSCKEFVNASAITREGRPYFLDETMRRIAGSVKKFELKAIGPKLARKWQ